MNPYVISFSGLARSGKDTSANYVVNYCKNRGLNVIKVGFADQLKLIGQKLIELFYGIFIPIKDFYDLEKKEEIRPEFPKFNGKPFSLRSVLQYVGSEVFREMMWGSIWCDVVYNKYLSTGQWDVVVISDCRFPDELNYLENLFDQRKLSGLITFTILRENYDHIDFDNQKHQSESHATTLPTMYKIDNNGTIGKLYKIINDFIADPIHDVVQLKPSKDENKYD